MASSQQRPVAGNEGMAPCWREPHEAVGTGRVCGLLHLLQQVFEVRGPGLVILLRDEGQLAQVVNVAERMAAGRVGAICIQPSWTLTPTKSGRMPIALVAAAPRLGWMA